MPYYDMKMLKRAEKSQIARVLRKEKYNHMLLEGQTHNIIGFVRTVLGLYRDDAIESSSSRRSQPPAPNLVLATVFGILNTLHNMFLVLNGKSLEAEALNKLNRFYKLSTSDGGKDHLIAGLGGVRLSSDQMSVLAQEVCVLVSIYRSGVYDPETVHTVPENLGHCKTIDSLNEDALDMFFKLPPHFIKNIFKLLLKFTLITGQKYTFDDLNAWIIALSHQEFAPAYQMISHRDGVPDFIAVDVLFKNITRPKDVQNLYKLFKETYDDIHPRNRYYVFSHVLNICCSYSSALVPSLTKFYLSSLKSVLIPCCSTLGNEPLPLLHNFDYHDDAHRLNLPVPNLVHISHLNHILYRLSGSTHNSTSYFDHLDLMRAQNLVIDFMVNSKKAPVEIRNHRMELRSLLKASQVTLKQQMDLLGNIAVLGSLVYISNPGVKEKFLNVENRFFKPLIETLSNVDEQKVLDKILTDNGVTPQAVYRLMTYVFNVKLRLCETSVELIKEFTEACSFNNSKFKYLNFDLKKSSLLWETFLLRLDEFGALDSTRVVQLVDKLERRDLPCTPHNTKMLCLLMRQVSDFPTLERLVRILSERKLMSTPVLEAYIVSLYKEAKSPGHLKNSHPRLQELGHGDMLSYVRSVVNLLDDIPVTIKGQIMLHEAQLRPREAYMLYQSYLEESGASPDLSCLVGLLLASLKEHDIVWDHQYAIQVAVAEFKHWTPLLYTELHEYRAKPNARVWEIYISALDKYNYLEQITELVIWWQNVRYIPTKKLLIRFLNALPEVEKQRFVLYGYNTLSQGAHKKSLKSQIKNQDVYVPIEYEYSPASWPWPSEKEVRLGIL